MCTLRGAFVARLASFEVMKTRIKSANVWLTFLGIQLIDEPVNECRLNGWFTFLTHLSQLVCFSSRPNEARLFGLLPAPSL